MLIVPEPLKVIAPLPEMLPVTLIAEPDEEAMVVVALLAQFPVTFTIVLLEGTEVVEPTVQAPAMVVVEELVIVLVPAPENIRLEKLVAGMVCPLAPL